METLTQYRDDEHGQLTAVFNRKFREFYLFNGRAPNAKMRLISRACSSCWPDN